MGKEIRLRIEACYSGLRPSEKRVADLCAWPYGGAEASAS